MDSSNKNRLKFISYAYAIGTILVVLGHSTPTGASDMPKTVDDIRTFIYCFHMPLFFFIAGFLFKYTTDKNKKPYSAFVKKKAIRFLTPYLFFSAIGIIPKILLSDFINDEVSFDWFYVFKAIFNPRENVWGHFWFLPTLLIIYILSYLLLVCYKNKAVYSIIIALTIFMALFPVTTNWLAIYDICDQLIYFCSGILFCNCILKKRNKIFKLPLALAAVALSIFLFVYFKVNFYFGFVWLKDLVFIVIAYFMLYAVFYFTILLEHKGCRLLEYFDGKTFSIYILSWPCQAVVEILVNRILNMHWYITMPLMFIAGIGIPLLISYLYSKLKYHPKFINLVLGIN